MEKSLYEEGRRASRYVVVKGLTKGGGALIYIGTLALYGVDYVLYAYWAVAVLTSLVDFYGQKYWAFKTPLETRKKIVQDFLLFMFIRGGTVLATTYTAFFLNEDCGMSILVATVVSLSIFVPVGFLLTRWLFYGTISDLWRSFKSTVKFW